jgi:hypothetical protein
MTKKPCQQDKPFYAANLKPLNKTALIMFPAPRFVIRAASRFPRRQPPD